MTGHVRLRVVSVTAIPLLVPLLAFIVFAAGCEDDWCAAGLREAAAYGVGFSALVLGLTAYLSTKSIPGWRAGLAAWAFACAAAGLVIMGSQFYERDIMVAMVWLWLSATMLVAGAVLARKRRSATGPGPGFGPAGDSNS